MSCQIQGSFRPGIVQVYGVVTRKDLVEPNAKLVSHRPNLRLLLALQGSHCSDILDARGCPCKKRDRECTDCTYMSPVAVTKVLLAPMLLSEIALIAPIMNCLDCLRHSSRRCFFAEILKSS